MLSSEESIQYPEKRFSPDLREKLTIQTDAAARFSVNSNLMNYSIPKNSDSSAKTMTTTANNNNNTVTPPSSFPLDRREIQKGDSDTRTRQLEAQIEQLTLQNVKLQRTNRLLKVDTDNLIEQKTRPLEQTIRDLTMANVRLQRASRLLQMEVEEKNKELNEYKQSQIIKMKQVGPEYEFLVQMVNLLQRQISGRPTCEDTCCFTMQPIDQSTMVMTLPSTENEDDEDDEVEAQHICRPIIHSTISQGSYAMELENKIIRLEQFIDELEQEKEQVIRQHSYKDNDVETLKKELKIKDDIVTQLEQDFMGLEDQIEHLQKELQDQTMFSNDNNRKPTNRHLSIPAQRDPRRQSQLLMESKRRSLAIKDTDLLEQMLRGDLAGFEDSDEQEEEEVDDDEEEQVLNLRVGSNNNNDDDDDNDSVITSNDLDDDEEKVEKESVTSRTVSPINDDSNESLKGNPDESSCLTCNAFPCTFPCKHSPPPTKPSNHSENDPFALFTGVTLILGFASQMGVTDDWTVPVTLATLVSGFLWSGNNNKKSKRIAHQQKITAVTVEE